jgi:hypothetical protein
MNILCSILMVLAIFLNIRAIIYGQGLYRLVAIGFTVLMVLNLLRF